MLLPIRLLLAVVVHALSGKSGTQTDKNGNLRAR
jgi:hypothetical protein